MSINPREAIGGNVAVTDYAKVEQERLASEYIGYLNTLNELSAEAEAKDVAIDDDETALKTGALIKRLRDLDKRVEETRVVEGEPWLRRKNACDAFFKGLRNIIQPEDKRERQTKPGWIDRLQGRINVYQDRKEQAERERLERERLEQARIARETAEKAERDRKEAERLKQEAEERAREAERARAPEHVARKTDIATEAAQAADAAAGDVVGSRLAAQQAAEAAHDAYIATLAKPADIVRTRGVTSAGAGVTLTKAKEPYAVVTDRNKLDKAKLWNSFTDDQVEMALRKWARATGHNEQMEGASIGWGTKGVTR